MARWPHRPSMSRTLQAVKVLDETLKLRTAGLRLQRDPIRGPGGCSVASAGVVCLFGSHMDLHSSKHGPIFHAACAETA